MPESLQQRIEKIRLWAKDPDRAASHILVTILAVIILVAIALWIVWIVPKHEAAAILDPEKRLTLENELRKTLTQIVLSIFGLFILYFTWQRARAGDKTVQIMEQGHITDRYTKAIEQLGKLDGDKPNIEVRLGAIYALERIARDSPRDHWTIMEVLTAYVRQNAPAAPKGETLEKPLPEKPRTDIQAVLTVLGRRLVGPKRENPDQALDLSFTHLQKASFYKGNWEKTDFSTANLQEANLNRTSLREAFFVDANLKGAFFRNADLRNAFLLDSNLEGVDLEDAELLGAHFSGANLTGAKNLGPDQMRTTWLWWEANLSPDFREALGPVPDKSNG
ncbi:pentapeptide repeat protein [Edaphobacter aggregans]|uniref:Pentapeptide repeat protein n=1 Tax=Edaphobacter aggregans TaxID=570835 RepID=A0A428MJA2_9BACT|nr:pentapeptide repeat-containing protein [Edaphobacter aggregans]RSL17041.1 pentapeptide repeat protein [Edaphobacter aggregans]